MRRLGYPRYGAQGGDWGSAVTHSIALTETAPMLSTPGRKCQNGRPVPVDRDDWKKYVVDLVEVGKVIHRAAVARDFDAFVDISDKLSLAKLSTEQVKQLEASHVTIEGSLDTSERDAANAFFDTVHRK
mgnify:CR=1 FL=1